MKYSCQFRLSDWGWLIVCGYPEKEGEEEGEKCEIKFTVGREGDDESLGKMETFSAQVFPPPRSLSVSLFPPNHSQLSSSSPPSRGISHSEKGVCIMPCSLRRRPRPRKAPPALTRSENPIFTAAKKNERNGKERREKGGKKVHNCFIPHRPTEAISSSSLPLSLVSSPCFGSCCHSIQHVLKTPTPRRYRGRRRREEEEEGVCLQTHISRPDTPAPSYI